MISLPKAHGVIDRLAQAGTPALLGMRELVAWLASESRGLLQFDLADIDIAADVASLRWWLERVLASAPPPSTAGVLWFGISNALSVRVAGPRAFDPDEMPGDWGWKNAWEPEERAQCRVLERIVAFAKASEANRNDIEYTLGLGFVSLAVREIVTIVAPSRVLAGAERRAITVGFDDGDYIAVGELSHEGLGVLSTEPSPPKPLPPETKLVQLERVPNAWLLQRKRRPIGLEMPMGFPFSGKPVPDGPPFVFDVYADGRPFELSYGLFFEPLCAPGVGEILDGLAPACLQRLPAEVEGHDVQVEMLALLHCPDWEALDREKQRLGVKFSQLGLPPVFYSGSPSTPFGMRREVADALVAAVPGVRLSPMKKPSVLNGR